MALKNSDKPINLVEISEKELSKYYKVKDKDSFEVGDFINIVDDTFAVLGEKNTLLKKLVSEKDRVYRKTKK